MRNGMNAEMQTASLVGIETIYNEHNTLQSVEVLDDYLEKQNIAWWSVDDLNLVITNGGYLHAEFFRAYFLPVLQRSLAFAKSHL